jgi:hypothetical protein
VIRVISLGAGVQSTAMSLMAAQGELEPMPDCAIFADTGWEPRAVYAHLEWLEGVLPFPVHRVSQGNLREAVTAGGFSSVPFFTEGGGMGPRQCTYQYKLRPIHRKVRELLGGKTPKGGAEMWIGISTDEMTRMKDSRVKYMVNRFPLVEAGVKRSDCLLWLERRGYPKPPRSACLGCPFKRNSEWRATRDGPQDEWIETIEADKLLRRPGRRTDQFMHASRKPLDEVDLSTSADHGQTEFGFLSECEGMCGV